MNIKFRNFAETDRELFREMAKKFYSPPAVLHFPPENVMMSCFDEALKNDGRVLGIMFEADGKPAGYSIVSMKFETEVGGQAAWIEELFVEEQLRGKGIGKQFFAFLTESLSGKIKRIRLEANDENEAAVGLYKKLGFEYLDYRQMVIDRDF